MYIKFWGCMGSLPRALIYKDINNKLRNIFEKYNKFLKKKIKSLKELDKLLEEFTNLTKISTYGGNTACIELRIKDNLIILDTGSGARELGLNLLKEDFGKGTGYATILLTHTHFDHIDGWPFFTPAYIPGNKFDIYGPAQHIELGIVGLRDILQMQMTHHFFPVPLHYLRTAIFHDLGKTTFNMGDIKVSTHPLQHTCETLAYKIEHENKVLVYATDNEINYNPYPEGYPDKITETMHQQKIKDIKDFCVGADIFICDAQYTPQEYQKKQGWGHNHYEDAVEMAKYANAKILVLFHHEPQHTDKEIEDILKESKKYAKRIGFNGKVISAYDGLEIKI